MILQLVTNNMKQCMVKVNRLTEAELGILLNPVSPTANTGTN